MRGAVLQVLLLAIFDVPHHHQRRASDKDKLQGPQADVGNGEDGVIAHVGAARLGRVAHKVLVLVAPHSLGRYHEHHHPEDKDHGEPDAAEHSGVFVDPADERLQSRPVHGCCLRGSGGEIEGIGRAPRETRWDEVLDELTLSKGGMTKQIRERRIVQELECEKLSLFIKYNSTAHSSFHIFNSIL